MAETRTTYRLDTTDTIRAGWVDDSPYLSMAADGRTPTLTMFLGVAYPQASLTDTAELAMRLIEALQEIHRELLQRAADPHAAGDGAKVPHRSINTTAELRTHLVVDHGLEVTEELVEATAESLDSRHDREHTTVQALGSMYPYLATTR